jgi:hypothetical protein
MISLSSRGPGLLFRRFGFGFVGMMYYYRIGSYLGMKWCPGSGSDRYGNELPRGCKPRLSAISSTGARPKRCGM